MGVQPRQTRPHWQTAIFAIFLYFCLYFAHRLGSSHEEILNDLQPPLEPLLHPQQQHPPQLHELQQQQQQTFSTPPDGQPYSLVVGLAHHKTGTFQLGCLLRHLANSAGLRRPQGKCFKDYGANRYHLASCVNFHDKDARFSGKRPILFRTNHGLQQTCQHHPNGTQGPWWPCLSSMLYKTTPCNRSRVEGMMNFVETQQFSDCSILLPPPSSPDEEQQQHQHLHIGFFNIIRNPIDAVLSAYTFHVGRPKAEPWLYIPKNASIIADKVAWAGADESTLRALGLKPSSWILEEERESTSTTEFENEESPQITYVELLERLPPQLGVVLEFWHSLPEIVSVARQYSILERNPNSFNVRFEDLRDSYNATVLQGIQKLRLGPYPEKILEETVAGGCDPHTWSTEQLAASEHITRGKQEEFKDVVEAALMGYAPAKRILCDLCAALRYEDDARCQ